MHMHIIWSRTRVLRKTFSDLLGHFSHHSLLDTPTHLHQLFAAKLTFGGCSTGSPCKIKQALVYVQLQVNILLHTAGDCSKWTETGSNLSLLTQTSKLPIKQV